MIVKPAQPVPDEVVLGHKYKTWDGRDVTIFVITLRNSIGEHVTFPVKGEYITILPSGRKIRTYDVWTLTGRWSVLKQSQLDLISCEEE